MHDDELEKIAVSLHQARLTAVPVGFVSDAYPELAWEQARAIARRTDALRIADGETQIGWKLGWTSAVMREALGVDRPNWGTLWASQRCSSALALDDLIHPKIEPELVWRAGGDLPLDATSDDVRSVGGAWALGIEVVDPRFPSFEFDALDNTADNSSSAAVRIGEFGQVDTSPSEQRVVFGDGGEARHGYGHQAMTDPIEAVAWLARSLAQEGLRVREGDIVFTGGLTAPYDAERGVDYTLSGPPLAPVNLRFD